MRRRFVSALLTLAIGLCATIHANAAVSPTPIRTAAPVVPLVKISCDQLGSDVSALLGEKKNISPNLAEATAEFERGVAECMWGQQDAANEHYRNARNLLGG